MYSVRYDWDSSLFRCTPWYLSAETRLWSQAFPCEFCEGKSGRHSEAILPALQFPVSAISFHRRSSYSFIVILHLSAGRNRRTFKQRFFLGRRVCLRIPLFWDMMLCNIRRFDWRAWCLRRESITHRYSVISQENSILYLQIALFGFQRVNSKVHSLSLREHAKLLYLLRGNQDAPSHANTPHSTNAGAQLTAPTTDHPAAPAPPPRYLHKLEDTLQLLCAAEGTREHTHRIVI